MVSFLVKVATASATDQETCKALHFDSCGESRGRQLSKCVTTVAAVSPGTNATQLSPGCAPSSGPWQSSCTSRPIPTPSVLGQSASARACVVYSPARLSLSRLLQSTLRGARTSCL
eukprot:scaffold5197_cov393-Prasinococcus_capsulatus_cf.AAC.1